MPKPVDRGLRVVERVLQVGELPVLNLVKAGCLTVSKLEGLERAAFAPPADAYHAGDTLGEHVLQEGVEGVVGVAHAQNRLARQRENGLRQEHPEKRLSRA